MRQTTWTTLVVLITTSSSFCISNIKQNGDITDPPVSTTDNNYSSSFAQAIEPPEWSTASTQDPVFCQTCIKNQHLYRSSLAQYLPSEGHPEYKRLSDNLESFRAELEHRYPQVCENCVERVQSKMKRALYGAKADAHGRLLERTRRNGGPGAKPRTWLELAQSMGGAAWAWGIYLQIACMAVGILHGVVQRTTESIEDDAIPTLEDDSALTHTIQNLVELATSFLFSIPETFVPVLPLATKASLILSIGSIWWNPQWRFTRKQNLHTVYGLYDWYAQQAVLLSLRIAAWIGSDVWLLRNAGAPTTLAVHGFILAFTIWISIYSTRKVTAKPRKLFAAAPDRDTLLPKKKNAGGSTTRKPNTLLDALESLDDEPAMPSSPITPSTTVNYASPESHRRLDDSPYRGREQTPTPSNNISGMARPVSQFPSSSRSTALDLSAAVNGSDPDAMEWTPTTSQHRAFNSGHSAQRNTQPFNNAPSSSERSVFWYKVPQAPMNPARKLRNPPIQPILSAPSAETKENFFRKATYDREHTSPMFGQNQPRRNYDFAQPKFFPPGADKDDTGLADLLGQSFNISDSETDAEEDIPKKRGSKSTTQGKSGGWKSWIGM